MNQNTQKVLRISKPNHQGKLMIKLKDVLNELNIQDKYLYHATYKPLIQKIKVEGLNTLNSKKSWEDSKPGFVYLADDIEIAASYAESSDMVPESWIDNIVVLKIDLSKIDMEKLSIDKNVIDNEGHTFEYEGVIPPSAIVEYIKYS
jgi:hypothetical protein